MTSHPNRLYRVACVVTKYLDIVISAETEDDALAEAEELYDSDGEDAFYHRDGNIDWHITEQTGENGGRP